MVDSHGIQESTNYKNRDKSKGKKFENQVKLTFEEIVREEKTQKGFHLSEAFE